MPTTEAQEMEMDMVQGMYDTYELISSDPPTYSVVLSPSADDPPELRVTIIYESEDYPTSATPVVRLEHIAKHRRMPTTTLAAEIAALCEEQIGMHSVISVLQQAQEFLTHYAAQEEKAQLQRRGDAMANASVHIAAPDPTVRVGTALTFELFAEWSRAHRAEKLAAREANEKERKKGPSKLTGRQLWDDTLKNTDWELFDAEEGGQDIDFDVLELNEEEEEMEYDLED